MHENASDLPRCTWVPPNDPVYVDYHDREWGNPVHDDRTLFEFLVLEGAQAGLSWKTVLHKRLDYRIAFHGFDPDAVAGFDDAEVETLLKNPRIIRNRLKINAAVANAKAFIRVREEFGDFDSYIWAFVKGKPVVNRWATVSEVPAKTPLSDLVSRGLSRRGFKFVGSTICYSFMQAVGIINDHTTGCFRYPELGGKL